VVDRVGEAGVFKTELSLEYSPPRLVATVVDADGREWKVALVTPNDGIAVLRQLLPQLRRVVGESMVSVGDREVDL